MKKIRPPLLNNRIGLYLVKTPSEAMRRLTSGTLLMQFSLDETS